MEARTRFLGSFDIKAMVWIATQENLLESCFPLQSCDSLSDPGVCRASWVDSRRPFRWMTGQSPVPEEALSGAS